MMEFHSKIYYKPQLWPVPIMFFPIQVAHEVENLSVQVVQFSYKHVDYSREVRVHKVL